MFDWSDMRIALTVARAGSVARAALLLGVDATTVSRRLRGLGKSLGVRLFERHAQGLKPTPAGRDLLAAAERMEQEALRVERAVSGADARVEGVVRITTIESFAASFVSRQLVPLLELHPELHVELVTGDQMLDLTRSEADLALRFNPGTQEGIVARKLGRLGFGIYAAASYLDRFGRPASVDDLSAHRCLGFDERFSAVLESRWLEPRLRGRPLAFRSNSTLALVSACVAGAGLALLPCYLAEPRGDLVRVFGPDQAMRRDLFAVMHTELRNVSRVRAVVDHLVEVFEANAGLLEDGVPQPTAPRRRRSG